MKKYQTKKVFFKGSMNCALSGRLDLPENPIGVAIFAHCFTGSKDYIATSRISKSLAEHNICVFRFDFTGLGESEGQFHETNFSSNVNDLVCAAQFLAKEYTPPSLLIGHSLGGAAVLFAAEKIKSVKGVVTLNAPCNPQHVQQHFEALIPTMMAQGFANVTIGGRSFKVTSQFLTDLNEQNTSKKLQDFQGALLVCHAPLDTVVGVEQAAHIFFQAKHPKSFISLDKADHLLTNPEDCLYVAHIIGAWAQKYIPNIQNASLFQE